MFQGLIYSTMSSSVTMLLRFDYAISSVSTYNELINGLVFATNDSIINHLWSFMLHSFGALIFFKARKRSIREFDNTKDSCMISYIALYKNYEEFT